jgi:hypothetical protein
VAAAVDLMLGILLLAVLLAALAGPTLAANRDRMPVPQPMSSTILSLNRKGLLRMAFM